MEEREKTEAVVDEEPGGEAPLEDSSPPRRDGKFLGFAGWLMFLWATALHVVLVYFSEYSPFARFGNLKSVLMGAKPAQVYWVVIAAEILSLLIVGRLVMAMVPTRSQRRRWLSTLVGLPIAYAGIWIFNYSAVVLLEDLASYSLAGPLAVIGGGVAAALSLAFFFTLALCEGAGKDGAGRGAVFARVLPVAALVGMVAFFLKNGAAMLKAVAFLGPALVAVAGLLIILWYFHSTPRFLKEGKEGRNAGRPAIPQAFFTGLLTVTIIGLSIVVPGPEHHLHANRPPPVVPDDSHISPRWMDKRGDKLIVESNRLTLVVGKDPFEFAIIDDNDRVVAKLSSVDDRSNDYRGAAMNTELRALTMLPLSDPGTLVKSRIRLRSRPMEAADEIRVAAGEVIAETRIGYRPFAVTFSFHDDDIVKITVDGGSRSPTSSTSIALAAMEGERFLGLGTAGRSIDRSGQDIELVTEEGSSWMSFKGQLLSKLSMGRVNLSVTGGDNSWPAPFVYLARRGVGIFVAETVDPRMELASRYPDAIRISGRGGPLNIFIITGSSMEEVIARYNDMRGLPETPPPGAMLPWMTAPGKGPDHFLPEMETARRRDIPVQYVHLDPGDECKGIEWDNNCGSLTKLLLEGRKSGFSFSFQDRAWIDREDDQYQAALESSYLVKNRVGLPYQVLTLSGTKSLIDYTNPDAVEWRSRFWKRMSEMGFSAMVLDPAALAPPESKLFLGESGYIMRNSLPLVYASAARDALGSQFVLGSATGFSGMSRLVSMVWAGAAGRADPENLVRQVSRMAGLSLSSSPPSFTGIPWTKRYGRDGMPRPVPTQGAAPLFVLPPALADMERAGETGEAYLNESKRLASEHVMMFPYYYSLAMSGAPIVRPVAALQPDKPEWYGVGDQYIIGDGLMAVLPHGFSDGRGAASLPPGRWADLDDMRIIDGREFGPGAGRLGLLLREGALVPVYSEAFETFAESERRGATTGNMDVAITVSWIAGKAAAFDMHDGSMLSARQVAETITLRLDGGPERDVTWLVLGCPEPLGVFNNRVRVPEDNWSWDPDRKALAIRDVPAPGIDLQVVTKL